MKKLLLLFCVLLAGASGAWAQRTVTVGSQVTAESSIVSGRAYILKTGADRYITDNGTKYDVPNAANSATEASVYFLIDNGDGTWKIKNYYTKNYWGVPVYNSALSSVAEEASAGAWSLNFSSSIAYPSAPDADGTTRGIDRSDGKVWGWSTGDNNNHKVYIYEVGSYNTFVTNDIIGKAISLGDAVSTPSTNTWYVIKNNHALDGTYYRGAIFETPGALYHDGSVATPSGTNYLFRLEDAGDGKYYVQTAYGNYWTDFTDKAQVGTRTPINGKEKITIAKIDDTDGHFYFQSSTTSVVLDANGLASGVSSGNVVGWSTTVPTSTGGNKDWGIYEVTLTDYVPTASEIYTINNTNASRGALTYAPEQDGDTKWVWSSGKSGAAFSASYDNHRWIIYPTGTTGQYYLYNVGAQKFAVPEKGGTYDDGNSYTWAFSSNAVAVTLNRQSDGTYKFITATGSVYLAVSNAYTGPIINYNDVGGNFTLTKVDTASDTVTTQLNTAVGNLIQNQTALSALPEGTGWYGIRIKTDSYYPDRFVYAFDSDVDSTYALGYNDGMLRPAIGNVTYYVKLRQTDDGYYLQLPNGKYIQNNGHPRSGTGESKILMTYDENGFVMKGTASGYYYAPDVQSGKSVIGGYNTIYTYYDIYPINLTTAGLTAWQVTVDASATSTQLTCSRDDVSGLATVYNNGYIFLPTSVTPTASDFTVTGSAGGVTDVVEVDTEAKTLTVKNYYTVITDYLTANNVQEAYNNRGKVGYPKNSAANIGNLATILGGINRNLSAYFTSAIYDALVSDFETYVSSTDIQYPEHGKSYKFVNIQQNGTTKYYLKEDGGTIVPTSTEAEAASFIAQVSGDDYAFALPNGYYFTWRGGKEGYDGNDGEIAPKATNVDMRFFTITQARRDSYASSKQPMCRPSDA